MCDFKQLFNFVKHKCAKEIHVCLNFIKGKCVAIIMSEKRKTMSYAGKITSDIIQTTSDIVLTICNHLDNKCLSRNLI